MPEPSYQTARLEEYYQGFVDIAEKLFRLVSQRVPPPQTKKYKGSYSVFASSTDETAVKLLVYESDKGKMNGVWPRLNNGVYVLVRTNGQVGQRIWNSLLTHRNGMFHEFCRRMSQDLTLGVAPKHQERFAYFPIMAGENLQEIANLLHWCSSR